MKSKLPKLTRALLKKEAFTFAVDHARHHEPALLGLNYPVIEQYYLLRFKNELAKHYQSPQIVSDDDIAFPDIKVDVRFINSRLESSYHPMCSGSQLYYGLGYDVLLFVYHQQSEKKTVGLHIRNAIWVEDYRTADWYATATLIDLLAKKPNQENVLALFEYLPFPISRGEAWKLSEDVFKMPPRQGYAAIGRSTDWHIRWGRVIKEAGKVEGIHLLK